MRRVLREASCVPASERDRPATPKSMVVMAARKVPTNTYANGWLNMRGSVGLLDIDGKGVAYA